jgi:hypothetical protein
MGNEQIEQSRRSGRRQMAEREVSSGAVRLGMWLVSSQ